ncbi:MAG: BMP family ABC transporter substrate-binding protein [Bacillota bacterium]|nr:BMP family ABC transporter substrate-binding protein [Bacillota bacterium]
MESRKDEPRSGGLPRSRRWRAGAVALALALSVGLAGCGGASSGAGTSQAPAGGASGGAPGAKPFKVGLVTDVGGINDRGFNQLAYEGLQRAQRELGVQGRVIQSKQQTDYIPNLSGLAQQGYNLVIAVGFLMQDQVQQVAKEYPNTHFAIIDVGIEGIPNLASAVFKYQEAGYLAGAMAGLIEKERALPGIKGTNKIGVVGGMSIPPVNAYIAGFEAGVRKVAPEVQVILRYANAFDDPAAGRELALAEAAQGAEIIQQAAGNTGTGVIEGAKQAGVYAIGVDMDQNYLAPRTVIFSALKRVDNVTFDLIKAAKEGRLQGGINVFDLKSGGVGVTRPIQGVPAGIVQRVDELRQQIVDGKIVPPDRLPK